MAQWPQFDRIQEADHLSGVHRSEDGKLSFGFSSFMGKRSSMEDFHDIQSLTIDKESVYFFGVFDGHGGPHAAEYLKNHLFQNLRNHPKFMTDTKLAISETYIRTDTDFLQAENNSQRDDGSTASTAIMIGNRLYVANVGDSRAIVSKDGEAIQLSEDHKPNRTDERKRIENAGGVVMWAGTWRVGGILAMSRAFGDRLLKQFVVSDPDIREEAVDNGLDFLVLASDGLWDYVSNEAAVEIVKPLDSPEAAARKLTETAYSSGSADNITCIVVRFHHDHPTAPTHPDASTSNSSTVLHPKDYTLAGSSDATSSIALDETLTVDPFLNIIAAASASTDASEDTSGQGQAKMI
ncbi:probable protein phosphatase 2C 52 isoform X2 [Asparagus officinalis]|uniref:probable protein phosphatase 2C 52 isoform X2 n=1 Tax=Asparagus officinalis TaxID=4686 RepID=UPI00098E402D|nr:probable protein phosphatase 2C 52 isoform X2 [Asparagus officinalis]